MASTDCGDKTCSLRHQLIKDCYLYVHSNSSDCNIPCHLEGCRKELHHFINCPIWECHFNNSTTTASTTTSTAATTEMPPIPPNPTPLPTSTVSIVLYISLLMNIIFVMSIVGCYAYKKFRVRRGYEQLSQQLTQHIDRRVSLLSNDNRFFSIGSNRDSESNRSGVAGEDAARNLNFQNIPLNNDSTSLALQREAHFEMTRTFSTFRSDPNVQVEPNVQLEITNEIHEQVTTL